MVVANKLSSRFTVLGGGISGLSAAYYLAKHHSNPSDITVLEASGRFGGWMHSKRSSEGAVFEQGPRSLRPAGPPGWTTLDLVSELGLESNIIPVNTSHPGATNRFIYCRGKVHKLPNSIISILKKQSLFSQSLLPTILEEPFKEKRISENDESVYSFFSRRLNREVAEYIGDPVCRGIFAGDARALSLRAVFPAVYEMEKNYGSVVKGALLGKSVKPGPDASPLVQRSINEKWSIWSLDGGLQTFADKLHNSLNQMGVKFIVGKPCFEIDFTDDCKAILQIAEEKLETDHLISSLSADRLASILPSSHSNLVDALSEIKPVSVGLVNLEYNGNIIKDEGFGVLLPSCEATKVLGIIYDSCLFPQHDRKDGGHTRLTVMMGGHWFEEQFGHPDIVDTGVLTDTAVDAVAKIMGVSKDPIKTLTSVQTNCISQYHIGHTSRVNRIFNYVRDNGLPLSLVGSSYKGVGVNDCVYNAKVMVEELVAKNGN
ncbi:protoporphyrinogen oxidase [Nematostella vectensis]|uniref:protoporphyrinogen oxidase n=1 Tax=Nematostella vectensis TaxID=45351 RepID=UPI00207739C7|nr:protoporphyrinogen oxidase [Nematostella vectensis]